MDNPQTILFSLTCNGNKVQGLTLRSAKARLHLTAHRGARITPDRRQSRGAQGIAQAIIRGLCPSVVRHLGPWVR